MIGWNKLGEQNPAARLTESQVIEIKKRLADGERRVLLASEYGVSTTAINRIATGKSWAHLNVEAS
jgi:hypothetical protein